MKQLKALVFCLVLMLAAGAAMPAFAEKISDFDPAHLCSLKVVLSTEDGQNAAGAEVVIWQVADVLTADDSFRYEWTKPFAECGLVPDDITAAKLANDLYAYAQKQKLEGISKFTDLNGTADFAELRSGLYLAAEQGNTGEFAAIKPFLIALPTVTGDEISYEGTALPKIAADRSARLKVNKVWNDDGKKRPENVQVQILRGDKVYDTVTLSEENNWTARWDCVVYADDWSVKEVSVPAGYVVTYQQNGMTFTVTNTEKLIQTGQLTRPIPYLAGGGLLLMLIGTALIFSGRRKNDEQG